MIDDPWYDALASEWGEGAGTGGPAVPGVPGARREPAPAHPRSAADIYLEVHRSAAFQEVRSRYRRFVVPATAGFLLWYLSYVVAATAAPELMSRPVFGAVNVAMLAGLGQFLTTFLLTWAYVRHAGRHRDQAALDLRWTVFDQGRAAAQRPRDEEEQPYGREERLPETYAPEASVPEMYGPRTYVPEGYADPEPYAPEPYAPQPYPSERYGTERYGTERYGAERYGAESAASAQVTASGWHAAGAAAPEAVAPGPVVPGQGGPGPVVPGQGGPGPVTAVRQVAREAAGLPLQPLPGRPATATGGEAAR